MEKTIQDYVYELIDLCERQEMPGVVDHIVELKTEIRQKFTREEILAEGIVI